MDRPRIQAIPRSTLLLQKAGDPMNRLKLALGIATLALLPGAASANGNQYGWCIGVGNPHQSANCGGSSGLQSVPLPSNVPTSNQIPSAGTGPGPTPGGTPATITVVPNPPQTVTGTGPIPPVVGQPGPAITGTGQLPIILQPLPQTVLTGVSPVPPLQTLPTPSFTGTGQVPITVQPVPPIVLTGVSPVPSIQTVAAPPLTGTGQPPVVIQPLPPATFTGTAPVGTIQTVPSPSFTGQGLPTIIVVPNPPTTVTGYAPVTASIIVQGRPGPGFSGYSAVPQQIPQAIPQASPQAAPQPTLQATPTMIPRPLPRPVAVVTQPGRITHTQTPTRAAVGENLITRKTGRQSVHDAPRFAAKDGGTWHCLASGHGKRRSFVDGEVAVTGALRHVGAVDVLGRDLPALHPDRTGCLISIRRRKE